MILPLPAQLIAMHEAFSSVILIRRGVLSPCFAILERNKLLVGLPRNDILLSACNQLAKLIKCGEPTKSGKGSKWISA
jgi:hypothetical protein